LRRAGGQEDIQFRLQIDNMKFTSTDSGDPMAIRRKMWIDPIAAGKLRYLRVRPSDHVQFARERHEYFAAVFRQLKVREAAQTLALTFPPAALFRGQLFLCALEEFLRREDFPQLSLGDGEFIQSQNRVARAAAQKDHGFAV